MKNSMSENMKWFLALFIATATSAMVTAIIALVYDEHYSAPALLAHLHDATQSGITPSCFLLRLRWRGSYESSGGGSMSADLCPDS